jgi:uncharacterized protein
MRPTQSDLPVLTSPQTAPTLSAKSDRILTLDILRGLALMGIFIVHGVTSFSGWFFMSPSERAAIPFPLANRITNELVNFILTDKSRTLFAFMFGVSFFLQLQSSNARNRSFRGVFLRRLSILFVIGLIHGHFFFGGDILRYYAVGGLFLLLAYRWPSRWLLITGFGLAVLIPFLMNLAIGMLKIPLDFSEWETFGKGFQSKSFLDNLYTNHRTAVWRYHWYLLVYFLVPVMGIFLFGVWMTRNRYIQEPVQFKAILKRMFWWGLAIGVLGQTTLLVAGLLADQKMFTPGPTFQLAASFFTQVNTLAMALAYVSGLTLLCLNPAWQQRLAILAPAGKMTLTNYVMQSVLGWLVFYGSGFGLFGKVSPWIALSITLGLCAFQLIYSRLWLRHFQFGPLEWCWRWAVQGQRPPLRRDMPVLS